MWSSAAKGKYEVQKTVKSPSNPKASSLYYLDMHSKGCDTLYREGEDGYIGLKINID